MRLPEWFAPLVIVGAIIFSAGLFGLCAGLPKIGEWFAALFRKPEE